MASYAFAGVIPWDWIADTERSVAVWGFWPDVNMFLNERLDSFRLNPWEPNAPPLILTETKGNAEVLESLAWEILLSDLRFERASWRFLANEHCATFQRERALLVDTS